MLVLLEADGLCTWERNMPMFVEFAQNMIEVLISQENNLLVLLPQSLFRLSEELEDLIFEALDELLIRHDLAKSF